MTNRSNLRAYPVFRAILAGALLLPVSLFAQEEGQGELPPLDVENVTIVGTRVIRLPAARKGEVVDSSRYILPAGDSLAFGARVSNFGGPGGALPEYREMDPPATANLEASIGTFISPRARVHGEIVKQPFDAMGTFEYATTAGHVDSADATSLLLEGRAGLVIGGGDPTAPRVRVGAGIDFGSDDYTLFGSRLAPYDRSRSSLLGDVMVSSAQDGLIDYGLYFRLEQTSVEDMLADSTHEANASTPGFGLALAAGDDTLRGRLFVDYQTTTLRYEGSRPTPNFVGAGALVEWNATRQLRIEAGLSYFGGQNSDSGSATLIAPRAMVRYTVSPALSLFAALAPEMRAPSYRSRLMQAPYVDRQVDLRPERVPVSFSAGVRAGLGDGVGGTSAIEARVLYESAENTPIVTADPLAAGTLRWAHVDTRTLALIASLSMTISREFAVGGELEFRNVKATVTDEQVPMAPRLMIAATGRYRLTPHIEVDARLAYAGDRQTILSSDASLRRTISSHLLLDLGAAYQIAGTFELFAQVTNLLAQQYQWWEGYEAPGLELRGGARLRF